MLLTDKPPTPPWKEVERYEIVTASAILQTVFRMPVVITQGAGVCPVIRQKACHWKVLSAFDAVTRLCGLRSSSSASSDVMPVREPVIVDLQHSLWL